MDNQDIDKIFHTDADASAQENNGQNERTDSAPAEEPTDERKDERKNLNESDGFADCEDCNTTDTGEKTFGECVEKVEKKLAKKCKCAKTFCKNTAERIKRDWKQTQGKPYIKKTNHCKVEVFESATDDTPVDTFQTTETKAYSLYTLAIAGGIAAALFCVSKKFFKGLFR